MPLYQTSCKTCFAEDTIWRKVDDRDNLPICPCGGLVSRVITAPTVLTDIVPYVSPATGKVINSRTQMRYDLESSGNIMNEPGLKQDIARNADSVKEKAFAPIAAAIDRTVTNLVNDRKLES